MAEQNRLIDNERGPALSKRRDLDYLWQQLENEYSSFRTHYRDLADNILPRRLRLDLSESNRGERKNNKLIDGTATMASRTLAAGMMSGITSPARKWFILQASDPGMKEFGPVKEWLHTVTERMNTVFLRSNLYKVFPIMYKDMGTFGTHAMSMEEDFEQVVRFYPYPVGSYRIAVDSRLQVRTFMREFRLTVMQVVEKFGQRDDKGNVDFTNFSDFIVEAYKRGNMMAPVDIRQVVRKNPNYDPSRAHIGKFKKYSSDYYEIGNGVSSGHANADQRAEAFEGKFLRESGFDYFPVLAPRWEVVGEDAYATDCPGMTALGDIKEAHLLRKRRSQAIEYVIRPPMKGSTALKQASASILPGDITYLDEVDSNKGFAPIYQINPDIAAISNEIQEVRQIISRSYYEDLFLMLANSDRREITAREIDERKEEKLLALGPVLEQLNQDVLDPLVENTYTIMERQGLIPSPPKELQGQNLKVEYISMMHQAQKLVGLAGHERFLQTLSTVQALEPTAIQKFDADQYLDEYADILTIPPDIIRTDEEVEAIRQAAAQAQQAQEQMQAVQAGAGAAKDLAGADLEGDNALGRILGG